MHLLEGDPLGQLGRRQLLDLFDGEPEREG
jgi:hypothetical protein